jgi:hypothetical protein
MPILEYYNAPMCLQPLTPLEKILLLCSKSHSQAPCQLSREETFRKGLPLQLFLEKRQGLSLFVY